MRVREGAISIPRVKLSRERSTKRARIHLRCTIRLARCSADATFPRAARHSCCAQFSGRCGHHRIVRDGSRCRFCCRHGDSFYDWFILPSSRSDFSPGVLIRVALILSIGFLIVYFFDRLRSRGIRLRSALSSLSEHADTLAQAQQGSNSAAWLINVKDRSIQWAQGGAEILGRSFQEVATLDALIQLVSPA